MNRVNISENNTDRPCPICGSDRSNSVPFLGKNIDENRIGASTFASRKVPEYMNYEMICCSGCDLVYVPNAPGQNDLALSYHAADYDSSREAKDAADAYITAVQPLLTKLSGRMNSALEIGTGTGVFLERLHDAGFNKLIGIEPSLAAISAAAPQTQDWIEEGIFKPGMYADESFDLIACFMTLEHVLDPSALIAAAYKMLRSGGAFVAVTHDYRSVVNRTLGRRSPIIDVEHMQLFSNSSIRALYESTGYTGIVCNSFYNAYRPSYWMKLFPIPDIIKMPSIKMIGMTPLDKLRIPINVGNMVSWGFKT